MALALVAYGMIAVLVFILTMMQKRSEDTRDFLWAGLTGLGWGLIFALFLICFVLAGGVILNDARKGLPIRKP